MDAERQWDRKPWVHLAMLLGNAVLYIPGILWLFAKMLLFFFFFAWVKATVPRYRYDQLMRLGWKIFLPLSLIFFFWCRAG